ncbi:MAG: DUF3108 domain-containing protein [Bacteroidales bacterium]|nr:DUF3108 domain-containing protein [Bacteroidales bacterium]
MYFPIKNIFSQDTINKPFKEGESLKYSLYYGWIDGGEGTLTLKKEKFNNKEVLHSVLTANTVGITDKIYRVKDIYESYIDIETDLPLKSVRNISEANYRWYNEVLFYHDIDSVLSQRSGMHSVPNNIQDIVSSFYKLRIIISEKAEIGSVIKIESYFADEVFPLYIRYKGIETIKTKLGKFECMKFSPVVEVGRVFKTKDDMTMWFSNDKNHLPMRIKFDLFIGSFKCDLIEYSNIKYPLINID